MDIRRLANLVGDSDVAHHQMLRFQLHAVDADRDVLEQDILLLQDFSRRFPASSLLDQWKLSLADRYLAIAREAANAPGPKGPDYRLALDRSQLALDTYAQVGKTGDAGARRLAERGREEALQIVAVSDTKLSPAPTAHLIADNQSVYRGQPVTLSWTTRNAARVILQPGIGSVEQRGSRVVTPAQSTEYHLVAYGRHGKAQATVKLQVSIQPPTVTLDVHPSVVQRGQPVTLVWMSSNADDLSLGPGLGSVDFSGTMQVYPEHSGAYVAIARGEGGSARAQAAVTVTEPPRIVTLMIPAGTQLSVRLAETLNSRSSRTGETFRASLV